MIINFHLESAKRRDRPGAGRASTTSHLQAPPKPAERPAYATPACGNAWYHDAAMSDPTTIRSHRDWDH